MLGALSERQARFRHARALVTNPHRTGFVFVVTPEHLPVAETERSVKMLDKYGIPVAAIFLNQVVPEDADGTLLGARRERQREYADRVRGSFSRISGARHSPVRWPAARAGGAGTSGRGVAEVGTRDVN